MPKASSKGVLGTEKDVIAQRIIAVTLDTIFLVFFSIFLLGFSIVAGGVGGLVLGLFLMIFFFALYGIIFEMWKGQTLGKMAMGIIVVKEDGRPCDFNAAFIRNLLRIVDGLFYYAVGFIIMAFNEKRQRLGDKLANTVVVKKRK